MTIPSKIVKKMGLVQGDMFDVVAKDDGTIVLVPVVVYAKERVKELEALAKQAKMDLHDDKLPVYNTADEAISALHASIGYFMYSLVFEKNFTKHYAKLSKSERAAVDNKASYACG